jgi:hypothetical protein
LTAQTEGRPGITSFDDAVKRQKIRLGPTGMKSACQNDTGGPLCGMMLAEVVETREGVGEVLRGSRASRPPSLTWMSWSLSLSGSGRLSTVNGI